MNKIFIASTLLILTLILMSCSTQKTDSPVTPDPGLAELEHDSNRALLGYYRATIDPVNESISIESHRTADFHMNVKHYLTGWPCSNCLRVKNIQFLPDNIIECDIEVEHPYPDPVFTVFDLRVIAIFPADTLIAGRGISRALLNRDGLTSLWDNPAILGDINGFKAYNKVTPRRPFAPGDILTERFEIKYQPGNLVFDIGVDAGWMPNDGVNFPIEMNSLAAIDLTGGVGPGLTSEGGSADLEVSFYDYQGVHTVDRVLAFSNQLFNAPVPLARITSDGHNATYGAAITNQKNAPEGNYRIMVAVVDVENASYPHEVISYILLNAEVYPADLNVEITLAEDADAKTPGNYYDMLTFSGPADFSVFNYDEFNGPWDFTQLIYTDQGVRKSLATDDPEVSDFADEFPLAGYFLKNFMEGVGIIYQAEGHDFARNELKMYGLYESEELGGAVVFTGTLDGFPFPYNIHTGFKRQYSTTLEGLPSKVSWDTLALGQGLCKVPYDGGTTRPALMLRTFLDVKTLGITVMRALLYEWYDDDGNQLAVIAAINMMGEDPNWDEDTFEIIGTGGITALLDYYRQ